MRLSCRQVQIQRCAICGGEMTSGHDPDCPQGQLQFLVLELRRDGLPDGEKSKIAARIKKLSAAVKKARKKKMMARKKAKLTVKKRSRKPARRRRVANSIDHFDPGDYSATVPKQR